MKKYMILTLALVFILAGCGAKDELKQADDTVTEPIAVELTISPDHIEANTVTTFSAKVTQAGQNVEDADEVLFEVGKKGDEQKEMIHGKHQGEGLYTIEKGFAEDGIYYVIAHVTARGMHNMPKKEFTVGHVEATHDDNNEQDSHHHHTAITIEFDTEAIIEAAKETTLTAIIHTEEHKVLVGADVQFEFWQDGDEKHFYVRAIEENGTYQAKTTFDQQGKYNVRIHVVKGDLHDHVEKTVEVK